MDEREQVDRWRAGDREAGQALVRRHYARVYGFFLGRVHDSAVEDLTQGTFETACGKIGKLELRSGLRGYLFAIARFKLLEHYRRTRALHARFDPLVDSVVDPELDRSVESLIGTRRRLSRFYISLRSLPVDAQILIQLKHVEQLTEGELAEMYGLSTNAMRARVTRARKRLREAMQHPDEANDSSAISDAEIVRHFEDLTVLQHERMALAGGPSV